MAQFCLTLDTSSIATGLMVTNALVPVPISQHLASPERYDGPAVISSSTRKGDSIVVTFTLNQYDLPHTLTAAVSGDTLRGWIQPYRDVPQAVVAVRQRLN